MPSIDADPLTRFLGTAEGTGVAILRRAVEQWPDNPFLTIGPQVWTYEQTWQESLAFASFVRAATARQAATSTLRIASYLDNRPEALWTWFGAHLAGALYIPLNRRHRGDILQDMVHRAQPHIVVTDRDGTSTLRDRPPSSGGATPLVYDIDEMSDDKRGPSFRHLAIEDIEETEPARPAPTDPAVMMFTSGTTGRSKAALLPHNQFVRGAAHIAVAAGLRSNDIAHGWLPLYHIGGQIDMVLPLALVGAQLELVKAFSRSRFWAEVASCQATVIYGFSTTLDYLWRADDRTHVDAAVRVGIVGGIPPGLDGAWQRRFGVRLVDVYGMTEAEPIAIRGVDDKIVPGSCGTPTSDWQVSIVDNHDRPVGPGVAGEIVARPRRPHVMMTGYADDSAATVERLRNLWLHTGDIGRMDADGRLYFLARRSELIRRKEENISSAEVAAVIRRHPAVAECAVVGVRPPEATEEEIKAVVVRKPGAELDARAVHSYCVRNMAPFMVPRYIEFRNELPRTSTDKIRMHMLTALDGSVSDTASWAVAPSDPVERA